MDEVNGFLKRTKIYNFGWFIFRLSLIFAFSTVSTTDFSNGQNINMLSYIIIFYTTFPYFFPYLKPQIKCSSCDENLSGIYTQNNLKVVVCPFCSKSPE